MADSSAPFRSLLFVPGARPDRFGKALDAGADAVCIDLEDAVPPESKQAAREAVYEFANAPRGAKGAALGFRVNGLSTLDGYKDVALLADVADRVDFIMIPKASSGAELQSLKAALGEACPSLWAIVESADGLAAADEITGAVGETGGVLFGGADFSADIGAPLEWEAMAYARGALVVACSRAGAQLLDVPHLDVTDDEGLATTTRRVKALGFTGRACIHPTQVAGVNAVFTPNDAEIEHAQRVIAAFDDASGGAALLNGKLIELPVIRSARRVLARAGV